MENITDHIYLSDSYIKEFDAIITISKKDYVCLNRTAFYPFGGGQPSDIGYINWLDKRIEVKEVIKKGNIIKHILLDERPPIGEKIHGLINWELRYNHMKMHTAQHIISGIVFDDFDARTVGNQIHTDYSRVDFFPISFTEKDLINIEKKFNEIISKNLSIKIYEEERKNLEKRVNQERCNMDLLPKQITNLRIIDIDRFDICPCAGTHVKNTKEIPEIDRIKRISKGEKTERLIYKFK